MTQRTERVAGEIREVLGTNNRYHVALMIYTAVMVPVTDFLTGVSSALILFFVFRRRFDVPTEVAEQPEGEAALQSSAE